MNPERDSLRVSAGALARLVADPLTAALLAARGITLATARLGVLLPPDEQTPCLWLSAHHSGVKGKCALLLGCDGGDVTLDIRHVTAPKFGASLPAGWVESLVARFVELDYRGGLFHIAVPGLVAAGIQGAALNLILEAG